MLPAVANWPLPVKGLDIGLKRSGDDLSHRVMGEDSVVQGVTEAVALPPANRSVFDEAADKGDLARPVHKDARVSVWHAPPQIKSLFSGVSAKSDRIVNGAVSPGLAA